MKFNEIKNIAIVYLHNSIHTYKAQQDRLFEGENTYLSPYIKGQVTMLTKEIDKLEKTLLADCYSYSRAIKTSDKIKDYYLRKAVKIEDGQPDEYISPEILKDKLGIDAYELMKSYFAIKAGIMCLEQEIIKERREDCNGMILKFKALKKFWEISILG